MTVEPEAGGRPPVIVTDIAGGVGFTTSPPHERHVRVLISPLLQAGIEGFSMGYTEIPPGCHGARHGHADTAELWLIFGGTGRAVVGDDEYDTAAGSVVYTPPGVAHQFFNVGPDPVRVFWVYLPDGEERAILEQRFR